MDRLFPIRQWQEWRTSVGRCSATEVFDAMCKSILDYPLHEISHRVKVELVESLIDALEDYDWDCQGDSAYRNHPVVKEAFALVHPDESDQT